MWKSSSKGCCKRMCQTDTGTRQPQTAARRRRYWKAQYQYCYLIECFLIEGIKTTADFNLMEAMEDDTPGLDQSHVNHVVDIYFGDIYLPRRTWVPLPHVRGRSGFYKVPADVRQQAGITEAGLLYDPKYVSLRKISDLLLQEEQREQEGQQDRSARRELSHFCYHLYSYGDRKRERIESLMQQLHDYKNFGDMIYRGLDPEERQLLWLDPPVSMVPQSLGLLFAVGFLLDLFSRFSSNSFSASEDPECAHSWATDLWSDLLLLENQIPLFRITCQNSDGLKTLFRNTGSYFVHFIPLNKPKYSLLLDEMQGVDSDRYRYLHVLHFVHEMLLPSDDDTTGESSSSCWGFIWSKIRRRLPQEEGLLSSMKSIPTVTGLKSVGVRFKAVDKEGFVVEFKNGVLKLPRLLVSQSMKKTLANLIAWEKCHKAAPKYFINYAIFMDRLIKTPNDVEILVQSNVFEHTENEVKTTFNVLGQGLVYTKPEDHERCDIFPKLTVEIDKYYQSRRYRYCLCRCHIWMAKLMNDYFNSPWSIISVIAALLIILLTMTQTFFSVYAYFRPPKSNG